jgi:phosphonate transport system substrate-binding protein
MSGLKITTCQAPNSEFVCRGLAHYLARRLNIAMQFIDDAPWQERERRLDAGEIDAAWICGLPYVRKVDRPDPSIELLVAPVMAAARYQDRPIYFSDVVVHAQSRYQSFSDLRGCTWAYNEPGSHSGYNLTRYQLARMGVARGYFGRVIESGAHQTSLAMLLKREIDASAIDSTVLELELARDASLVKQMRIVETWGPSPIPPWVVSKRLPDEVKHALRDALLRMHEDAEGRAILHAGQMARFVEVRDDDYAVIREMERGAGDRVFW